MKKKVVFTGCSFTAGTGWVDMGSPEDSIKTSNRYHPDLWVNLCHQHIEKLQRLELHNKAMGGASNVEIFRQCIDAMTAFGDEIEILFCQWTSMPRYNFNAGFELWQTNGHLGSRHLHDINLNRGDHWPREYVQDLLDRLCVMHHPHWDILTLIELTNTIKQLAHRLGIQHVFFINGLCPWDRDYFTYLPDVKPESFTPYTKQDILNIETRSDEDIYKLYHMAHAQYAAAGGICADDWINLYRSFLSCCIDYNFDDRHPGKQSNLIYFNTIKEFMDMVQKKPHDKLVSDND